MKNDLMKSDILKMKYTSDTPTVKQKDVKKQIDKYLKSIPVDTKYLLLNSRKLNFVQVFDISDKLTSKAISDFLYHYFKDTSYMFKSKMYPLTDIKDIYEEDNILNIYYAPEKAEFIDFILFPCNYIVEKVK